MASKAQRAARARVKLEESGKLEKGGKHSTARGVLKDGGKWAVVGTALKERGYERKRRLEREKSTRAQEENANSNWDIQIKEEKRGMGPEKGGK